MKCRKFTLADQLAYAELSGDYNPLHVDSVAARRLLFGSIIVHGPHSILWGLDRWLEAKTAHVEFLSIKGVFPKPIRIDEEVCLSFENESEGRFTIELRSNESIAATIDVEWKKSEQQVIDNLAKGFPKKQEPRVLSEDEIESCSGNIDLCINTEATQKMFPNLFRCVSQMQIAVILGLTRLIGVQCPGLRSTLFELHLSASGSHKINNLTYKVTNLDKRFGLVFMNYMAPGMKGTIKAFIRPLHQEQAGYQSLKNLVVRDEFAGQRALVIGGSRGLGELSAKLLAAGGAEVTITYSQGAKDAQRIVEEIGSNGGVADSVHFNILSPPKDFYDSLMSNWIPTHLYYFATPFMFSGIKGVFSTKLFNKFCDFYVTGFLNTINPLIKSGLKSVFNPSSIAIDEIPKDLGEYAAAKSAAEMLCMYLRKTSKDLIIYSPRLPRMNTDQTVSLVPINNQDPVPIILEHLRSFRDAS